MVFKDSLVAMQKPNSAKLTCSILTFWLDTIKLAYAQSEYTLV